MHLNHLRFLLKKPNYQRFLNVCIKKKKAQQIVTNHYIDQ